jgi:hypothetical protein
VIELVLARAQFAFVNEAFDVAVILTANAVTNFVARGLHRVPGSV